MIALSLVLWVNAATAAGVPPLKNGDIVLQASETEGAEAIRKVTDSPYSNTGIVEVAEDGVYVVEAISPVSRTPFEKWRRRGVGGQLTVMRPRLAASQLEAVVEKAKDELGKPHDDRYAWDDDKLYCSELVVKAFERGAHVSYGERVRLDQLRLGLFEKMFAKRAGVSLSQVVVPPGTLAADPKLDVVFSNVVLGQ